MFYVITNRGAVDVLCHHKPMSCRCSTSSQAEELSMFYVITSRGAVDVLRHHMPRSCRCSTSSQAEEL